VTSDEDRWSEARSLLERQPTAPAERRLRRGRRRRILIVLAAGLVFGVPIGIVAFRYSDASSSSSAAEVPAWQEIVGLALAGIGLVVMLGGIVAQFRTNRRTAAWRSPLYVLTDGQRKELVTAVRGRTALHPDRVPLARHLASTMIGQRVLLVLYLGLALHWTGQLVASPSWWRAALAGLVVVLIAIGVPVVVRQERQARRFLAEHQDDDGSVA
jgi:protein-S-isoprenylcysteine O-methyltransferase Ste14